MKKILLVEDEESLQELLRMNLEAEGYSVRVVDSGTGAMKIIEHESFDLLILDVMLPGLDGFTVCQRIRMTNREIPILFLTAKDSAEDRIQGLKIGGDDYLPKPFELEELLLRIANLLKRTYPEEAKKGAIYYFGDNEVNLDTFVAKSPNGEFRLTRIEAKLLKLFFDHKNQVLSRKKILNTVWGYDVYPSTRTVDNFILALRKYFEKDSRKPEYFQSIRGVGYKFSDDQ
jgi:two-component system alkaline phosphatase synthesis response regulator PhoP